MSLFSTMNIGASGLGTTSTWMSSIGDNISNLNTTGFKGGRIAFSDMMPQHVFGSSGGGMIGSGAGTSHVATLFGQGSLESTENALDLAITGEGFFMVSNGEQSYYTRAGEFGLDTEGYVVNAAGLRVQGYSGENGSVSGALDDLRLPEGGLAGSATTSVVLEATLSAEEEVAANVAALDFFGTGAGSSTLLDAGDAAQFTTSQTIYDSRGVGHDMTLLFERTGANDWSYRAVVDASEAYDSTGTAFSSETGYAFEVSSGTLTFDTSGALTAVTQTDTSATTPWSFAGTDTPAITLDFGLDTLGAATDGVVKMQGEESSVAAITQDGVMTGELNSVKVDEDGMVWGAYTNGEEVEIGRVAIASFQSTSGLERVGGSLFRATPESGAPAVGAAGTGSRGSISGNALEKSNVDLESEFVTMITAQRSYQASSKVVSTANDTLQTLLQLI